MSLYICACKSHPYIFENEETLVFFLGSRYRKVETARIFVTYIWPIYLGFNKFKDVICMPMFFVYCGHFVPKRFCKANEWYGCMFFSLSFSVYLPRLTNRAVVLPKATSKYRKSWCKIIVSTDWLSHVQLNNIYNYRSFAWKTCGHCHLQIFWLHVSFVYNSLRKCFFILCNV